MRGVICRSSIFVLLVASLVVESKLNLRNVDRSSRTSNVRNVDRQLRILGENRTFDLGHVPAIFAVGLNYPDHAHQVANATPTSPIIFMKNRNALTLSDSEVIVPLCSASPDFEAELGVIIKDTFRDSSVEDALEHVLGYTVVNDISGRCWQKNWNEA